MSDAHDPAHETTDEPFVSVIVPVYEYPEGIATTLEALVTQTYPTEQYEVVVVDNGSTDETPDVVREFADAHRQVRLVIEPAGGSYAARNAGIGVARGPVFSFVDADMWVEPDWLSRIVDRLSETGADALACDVAIAAPSGEQSLAERYNRRTAFPIQRYVEDWGFAPTCCLTVRRDVFDDIGPFDARLDSSGDREFGNRLVAAGYKLVFAEDVTMTHPPRTNLNSLVRKAVRIGVGRYQVRRYHPDRYGQPSTQLVSPLNYTPPLPGSMANHVRDWEELPPTRQAMFLLLAWVLTLAKAYGTWHEALESLGGAGGTPAGPSTGTD